MMDKNKKEIRKAYIMNLAVICVVLIAIGVIQSIILSGGGQNYPSVYKFYSLQLIPSIWQCCYLIILASSLNLVLGFLGQLSLGHCGFMAIGAYTAALLSLACERAGLYTDKESPVYLFVIVASILLGGVLASLVGILIGIPSLRLKGDYLAIITLGFGMIIVNVINNLPFCGQNGLSEGAAGASLYATGLGFSSILKVKYIWIALFTTIFSVTIMFMFVRSKFGRAVKAIRDDEIAAAASGLNVSAYKVKTFVFSAFFAGVAGGIYACCNSALSTSSFAFTNGSILNSTFVVVMVVLGGMGSLTGSVIAAVAMFLLNYIIKNVINVSGAPLFVQNIFTYPMLVYAIVLIVIIMFRPKGLFGTREFSLIKIWNRIFHKNKEEGGAAA